MWRLTYGVWNHSSPNALHWSLFHLLDSSHDRIQGWWRHPEQSLLRRCFYLCKQKKMKEKFCLSLSLSLSIRTNVHVRSRGENNQRRKKSTCLLSARVTMDADERSALLKTECVLIHFHHRSRSHLGFRKSVIYSRVVGSIVPELILFHFSDSLNVRLHRHSLRVSCRQCLFADFQSPSETLSSVGKQSRPELDGSNVV